MGVHSDRHVDDAAALADSRADLVEVDDGDPAFEDLSSGTAALIAENQGLRASVAKYKRKVALANSRADEAEKETRELRVKVFNLENRLQHVLGRIRYALEIGESK